MDPSTKSRDKRDAISGRDKPVSLLPVEVGAPNGASAVNCFKPSGKASTSACATGGFDTYESVKTDAAETLFVNQLRREESWFGGSGGMLDVPLADSTVQVAATKLAVNDKEIGCMICTL